MDWNKQVLSKIDFENIDNIEEKKQIAKKIANKVKNGDVIGFGSGSTSYVTICEIAEKIQKENIKITAIPTSYEVELLCNYLNIPTTTLLNQKPNWSFDGADKVDKNMWMIKGRGGAMFREKLNIVNSENTYILVDKSKLVDNLNHDFSIPIECYSYAINYIKEKLISLGATEINIRKAKQKDGPVITESGNIILDVKFENISKHLEEDIKKITGVIETGLFIDYKVEIITC